MNSKLVLAVLLLLGCLQSGRAEAQLEISPVMVNLLPGQNVATVQVTNRGGASAAIQIRAYSWSQKGNEDVLTPTQDVVLSPPIFTVPKGAAQTVRLLLRGRTGGAKESSYRLLIDEVPPANVHEQQVAIAMRISLPMIAGSVPVTAQKLQWKAERRRGNKILLSVTNPGETYEKVQDLVVTLSDGSQPRAVADATNPYVLAGAQRQWIVQDSSAPTDALRLSVTTRAGKGEHKLALAP